MRSLWHWATVLTVAVVINVAMLAHADASSVALESWQAFTGGVGVDLTDDDYGPWVFHYWGAIGSDDGPPNWADTFGQLDIGYRAGDVIVYAGGYDFQHTLSPRFDGHVGVIVGARGVLPVSPNVGIVYDLGFLPADTWSQRDAVHSSIPGYKWSLGIQVRLSPDTYIQVGQRVICFDLARDGTCGHEWLGPWASYGVNF